MFVYDYEVIEKSVETVLFVELMTSYGKDVYEIIKSMDFNQAYRWSNLKSVP